MSKHQNCPRCGFDFVGPDDNIGENLCPDCEDEICEVDKNEYESGEQEDEQNP